MKKAASILNRRILDYDDLWPIDYLPVNREETIRRTLKSLFFYLVFLVIASIVIITMVPPLLFTFTNVIKGQFIEIDFISDGQEDPLTFDDIRTVEDVWEYLSTVAIPNLYVAQWASRLNTTAKYRKTVLVENIVLGAPRLRQLRVDRKHCEVHPSLQKYFTRCYDSYSMYSEDTSEENYTSHNSLLFYFGYISTYPSGGIIELLKKDKGDALTQLADLYENLWIKQSTRVVFFDFTLFNINLNLFCIVKIIFEFPASGGVIPSSHFLTVKLMRYNEPHDFKILGLELIYIGYIAYFIGQEVRNLRFYGKEYWTFFWTYINISIIIGSLILIPFNTYKFIFVPFKIKDISKNEDKFANMEFIALWQWTINNIHAILLFFIWIKIFKYLKINRVLGQFGATLSKCAKELSVFSFMFLIIFITYAFMGYILFGEQNEDFNTFPNSLMTLLITVLGDFNYYAIERENRMLAPLYFTTYIFLVFFVLINMFVAIITDTYSNIKDEIKTAKNELSICEFLLRLPKKIIKCIVPECKYWHKETMKLSDKEALDEIKKILVICNFTELEIAKFFAMYIPKKTPEEEEKEKLEGGDIIKQKQPKKNLEYDENEEVEDEKEKEKDEYKESKFDLLLQDIKKYKPIIDEYPYEKKPTMKDFENFQKRFDTLSVQFTSFSNIMEKLIGIYNDLKAKKQT